jgi:flavin reductase (DIM6/NTAB) family NADH-FMN oxidoreductase RutF
VGRVVRMDAEFRNAMSLVPTSVSIVALNNNSKIIACTVSSLVSVSIDPQNPEILFVLKKGSHTGSVIEKNRFFTLNILANNQQSFALEFSKQRDLDQEFDLNRWKFGSRNFVELIGSRVIMDCEIIQIYEKHLANIYVAKVLDYKFDITKPALIYDERKYGSFHPNSQN